MTSTRSWALAGVVTGATGLAVSHLVAAWMSVRDSPFVSVAEEVVRLTPGPVASWAVETLGGGAKTALMVGMALILALLFALAGSLWPRRTWASLLIWLALSGAALGAAVLSSGTGPTETLPIAAGLVVWLVALAALTAADKTQTQEPAEPVPNTTVPTTGPATDPITDPATEPTRRGFTLTMAAVALVGVFSGGLGRLVSARTTAVQERRRLLRIPGVTQRKVPRRARIGLSGVTPWRTQNDDFYVVHTALAVPVIDPGEWRLRIHGMVEREVVLTYDQLVTSGLHESWVTLGCVSNEVGGDLVGNAWWSGVLTRELLARAGPLPGADAVLQTSDDGWTCSTPLEAMTDDRNAVLAVAMNGEPLPIEHGFPVRTVVPGLYGYTSACKWVVDLEVTRFADVTAYWTERNWAEQAPVRLASRIDVPRKGQTLPTGTQWVGGVAWQQGTGIRSVEIALDGGDWTPCQVALPGTQDTWVQWAAQVELDPGDHMLRVRAVSASGEVQTGARRESLPDGATGWHAVTFTAEEQDDA